MERRNVTALIIDDDRAIQRMLAETLTAEGFTVQVEKDGSWAFKTFSKRRPDVVILDLLLPSMHGFEFARHVRQLPNGHEVPIIFISGAYKASAHEADSIRKYKISAFLEKPIHLGKLREALKAALGRRYPSVNVARLAAERAQFDAKPADEFADERAHAEVAVVESSSAPQKSASKRTIRGTLDQKPFPVLLVDLIRWRSTGALLLKREKLKKIVYFRDGRPVSVKSNLLSECLGKLMVREKMITEAECQESLSRMKATGRQQGTVLIEMGCINPHNLNYALSLQLQTKLFDIFGWTSGDYQFNPEAEVPPETGGLDMTPVEMVYEGIKRGYDEGRLGEAIGDVGAHYVHPAEDPLLRFQEVGLDEEETALLHAMDGCKSVSTLVALGLLPPHATMRLIYALSCAQMIVLKKARAAQPLAFVAAEDADERSTAPAPIGARVTAGPASLPPPLPPPPPSMPPAARVSRPPVFPADAPSSMSMDWATSPQSAAAPAQQGLATRRGGSLMPELSGVFNLAEASSDTRGQRERLTATLAAMQHKDYFERLGVRPDAPTAKIKKAYLALAREYHPDKHFGASSVEVHRLAADIFDLISVAHDTLVDEEARQRYELELERRVKPLAAETSSNALAAEGKFQRGEALFRQRNYAEAFQFFQEAVALCGDEGVFHAWLGWTAYHLAPSDPATVDRARLQLDRAIQLNPRYDQAHLFRGYIEKENNRPDRAQSHFEHALQANPDCIEALRELRLLGVVGRGR
ncbi:MAG: response regulator [Myxococcales bacterium]|nr:response regulator [Myxococcales bacterium]